MTLTAPILHWGPVKMTLTAPILHWGPVKSATCLSCPPACVRCNHVAWPPVPACVLCNHVAWPLVPAN
jgi:hypothetical protein